MSTQWSHARAQHTAWEAQQGSVRSWGPPDGAPQLAAGLPKRKGTHPGSLSVNRVCYEFLVHCGCVLARCWPKMYAWSKAEVTPA